MKYTSASPGAGELNPAANEKLASRTARLPAQIAVRLIVLLLIA